MIYNEEQDKQIIAHEVSEAITAMVQKDFADRFVTDWRAVRSADAIIDELERCEKAMRR